RRQGLVFVRQEAIPGHRTDFDHPHLAGTGWTIQSFRALSGLDSLKNCSEWDMVPRLCGNPTLCLHSSIASSSCMSEVISSSNFLIFHRIVFGVSYCISSWTTFL